MENKNSYIIILIFLCIDILLVGKNFLMPGIFMHGDLSQPLTVQSYINNYIYLFSDSTSLSNLESIDRAIFILPISYFFKILGIIEAKYIVASIIFICLLVSQISFLFLLKNVFKINNFTALLFSSIFYSLSPWVQEQFPAVLFWLAYALIPLFLMYTIKLFTENKKLKNSIILSLILSFIGTTPHYLIYSGVIFIIIGFFLFFKKKSEIKKFIYDSSIKIFILFIVFLFLNFYWIYPTMNILTNKVAISPGYDVTESSIDLFSRNISPISLVQGLEQWIYWYKNDPFFNVLSNPLWIFCSFIPLALTIYIFLKRYNQKYLYFNLFVLLSFVFFIFSLGGMLPGYKWLIFQSPLRSIGWIFRVPGKLSFFIWIFFSICLGIFIKEFNKNKIQKIIRILIIILLIFFIFPKSFAYLEKYYSPVEYPNGYDQLFEYLNNYSNGDKTIFLAPYQYSMGQNSLNYEVSFTWNKDRVATNFPACSSEPGIFYYHLTYRNWQNTIFQEIYPEFIGKDPNEGIPNKIGRDYLSYVNVKYLVFHNDLVGSENKGNEAVNILKNKTDLIFIKKFGDSIFLFENPYLKNVLYTDNPNEEINITKIDPTKYEFKASINNPSYIYFAQTFDPLWKMKINNKIISPEKDENLDLIKFKVEEKGEISGEIFYFPQAYYNEGLVISGITFVTFLIYLMVSYIIQRRKKRIEVY